MVSLQLNKRINDVFKQKFKLESKLYFQITQNSILVNVKQNNVLLLFNLSAFGHFVSLQSVFKSMAILKV